MFDSEFDPHRFVLENQEGIVEYFFDLKLDGKNIICLFREDKKPTCGFYYSKTGRLYYHDFKTGDNLDAIGMVMTKFKINRTMAMKKILEHKSKFVRKEKKVKEEKIYTFLEHDNFDYFKGYHISRSTIDHFRVKAIKTLYINENVYKRWRDSNPLFCYSFQSKRYKFYRPITKNDDKWLGNSTSDDVFGLDKLPWSGQCVIVTSSAKDVMVLKELGFNAISFNSETITLQNTTVKSVMNSLKRRFKYIFIYMDNDETGLKTNKKLSEFVDGYAISNPYHLKDISDHCKHYGLKTTRKMLHKLIGKQVKFNKVNVIQDVPF